MFGKLLLLLTLVNAREHGLRGPGSNSTVLTIAPVPNKSLVVYKAPKNPMCMIKPKKEKYWSNTTIAY